MTVVDSVGWRATLAFASRVTDALPVFGELSTIGWVVSGYDSGPVEKRFSMV
jgi:hypothetical protein